MDGKWSLKLKVACSRNMTNFKFLFSLKYPEQLKVETSIFYSGWPCEVFAFVFTVAEVGMTSLHFGK